MAEIPGLGEACGMGKPSSAMDSNKHKTSLEQSHQMPSHYSFQSKSVKWWKKFFFYSEPSTNKCSYFVPYAPQSKSTIG
jgi:hypothetical protein